MSFCIGSINVLEKLLDDTVTKDKLADACVSAAKLARDALMSQSLEVPFQPCVFSKGKWEIVDEGSTIHHFLTEYESGYYGGGIKVPRAERFDKLYVEMDYCNDQLMHYYVVGSKLVNLGSTPLCYWCPFHSTSPNADPKFSGLCQYHSLWTPEKKSFAVLNPYGQEIKKETKRKLVF